MKRIFIISLFIIPFLVIGKEKNKDTPFQKKYDSLSQLCKQHRKDNPQIALKYGLKLKKLTENTEDLSYIAGSYLSIAISYFFMDNLDSCTQYLIPIIEMEIEKEKEAKLKGSAYNILCIVSKHKGDFEKALAYGAKSSRLHSKGGDMRNYGMSLNNIAGILSNMGDYKRAIDSSFKALSIFEGIKDTTSIATTLHDIANQYIDLGDSKLGLKYILKAKRLFKIMKDDYYYGRTLAFIGTLANDDGQNDTALFYYKEALRIFEEKKMNKDIARTRQNIGNAQVEMGEKEIGLQNIFYAYNYYQESKDEIELAYVSKEIGYVYMKSNEFNKAEKYLLQAKQIADRIGEFYLQHKLNEYLYHLNEKKGRYKISLNYYKQYEKEEDSLMGLDIKSKILELSTKYETAIKEQKIKDLQYKQEKQLMNKKILVALFVGAILILILILVFLLVRAKKNKEINQQKVIVYEKEKALIKAQLENEKFLQEELQKENQYKSKQLTTHALNMLQKNKLLQEMDVELKHSVSRMDDEVKRNINSIRRQIKRNMSTEKDWNLFKLYFEEVNKDFLSNLQKNYANITTNDLRLAALIKLNLNIKEAAAVLNIEPDSLKKARYRLRQKLGLRNGENFGDFFNRIS